MKLEIQSLLGKFLVVALIPVLIGSGCKSNNQAAASLPPANQSTYPSNLAATPAEGSIYAADENKIIDLTGGDKPAAPKPKPFVLRDGETLVSHKVVSGDNLSKLASRYDTSIGRIQAANNMTGSVIITGKTYKIPTKKSETEIAESLKATTPSKPSTPESVTITKPSNNFQSPSSASLPPKLNESTSGNTFTTPTTFTPPTADSRPTFTPRSFDEYNGPTITTDQESVSSTSLPVDTSSPTFGSGAF